MYRIFGHAQIFTPGERFRQLNTRVEKLLADWSDKAPPRPLHVLGDMTRMRLMMLLGLDLASRRSPEQAMENARKNLDRLEEFALVLFWQAVSECYPDHPALKTQPWANAWRIHLDPEKWEADGVFQFETAPRPLQSMRDNFSGIFGPQTLREKLLINLPYKVLHWGNGFVYYKIAFWIRKQIYVNKPAMWTRWALVHDYSSKK